MNAYEYTIMGGALAAVKGLSLQSPFIGTSFKVQWQMTAGATGYVIQIRSDGNLLREVITTNTDYSYSLDEAKIDGVKRSYTVRVASKSGENISAFSIINVSNQVPPPLLSVYKSATSTEISVTWVPSEVPDLKDYQVWLSTDANFDPIFTAPRWSGAINSCTISSLKPTTTYYIRVAARDIWQQAVWNYSERLVQTTADS